MRRTLRQRVRRIATFVNSRLIQPVLGDLFPEDNRYPIDDRYPGA